MWEILRIFPHKNPLFLLINFVFWGCASVRPQRKRAVIDRPLCRGIQHIFDKNAIAGGGIVYKDVGHGADELATLDNRTAAHECVKCRTKLFCKILRIFVFGVEKQRII